MADEISAAFVRAFATPSPAHTENNPEASPFQYLD